MTEDQKVIVEALTDAMLYGRSLISVTHDGKSFKMSVIKQQQQFQNVPFNG